MSPRKLLLFCLSITIGCVRNYVLTNNFSEPVLDHVTKNQLKEAENASANRTHRDASSLNVSDESISLDSILNSSNISVATTMASEIVTDTHMILDWNYNSSDYPNGDGTVLAESTAASSPTFITVTMDNNNSDVSTTLSGKNLTKPDHWTGAVTVTLYVSAETSRKYSTASTTMYDYTIYEDNGSTETGSAESTISSVKNTSNEGLYWNTSTRFVTADGSSSERIDSKTPENPNPFGDFFIYFLGSALAVVLVVLFYVVGCFYLYQRRPNEVLALVT